MESTARDAMFTDHYVVIAEDCVGSDDKAQHEASMFLMRHRFDLARAEDIAAGWTGARHPGSPRRPGGRRDAGTCLCAPGGVVAALVTGAASGIGAGIAEAFAGEGADLHLVDLVDEQAAAPALDAARRHGGRVTYSRADVADETQVRAAAAAAVSAHGRVDVLVNNAGIFTQSLLEDMPVQDWDRVLAVNLRGTFLFTRVLISPMLERGWGRVINIASQLGQVGGAEVAHYSGEQGCGDRVDQGPLPRGGAPRRPGQRDRARPDQDAAARR